MIKLQDLTPAIYYTQSRDFQFIGRLYDIVLNYLKTNADNINNLPIGRNMDERLLNLLSMTLGFQSRHKYNSIQLRAICSVLPEILRNKGSIQAIIIAVNAMLHAENIKQALDYKIINKQHITLYLPQELSDLKLLRDLLIYILPAGIGCSMVKEVSRTVPVTTELKSEDIVTIYYHSADDDHILDVRNADVLSKMNSDESVINKPTNLPTNGVENSDGVLVNAIINPRDKN